MSAATPRTARQARMAYYELLVPPPPMSVCGRCAAVVPATPLAQQVHHAHHARTDRLREALDGALTRLETS